LPDFGRVLAVDGSKAIETHAKPRGKQGAPRKAESRRDVDRGFMLLEGVMSI